MAKNFIIIIDIIDYFRIEGPFFGKREIGNR